MDVHCYCKNNQLPFYSKPAQPIALFTPHEMSEFKRRNTDNQLMVNSPVWNVIMGLYSMEKCNFNAHISIDINKGEKTWNYEPKILFQITTIAKREENGEPLIVGNKNPMVNIICGAYNDPNELSPELFQSCNQHLGNEYWIDFLNEPGSQESWTQYFEEKLEIAKSFLSKKGRNQQHVENNFYRS